MNRIKGALAAGMLLALGGCAVQGPPAAASSNTPPQWHTPLPHHGNLADLANWWQRQGDSLLVELISDAQQASPDIATAHTRIVQSRADRIASGAALATLDPRQLQLFGRDRRGPTARETASSERSAAPSHSRPVAATRERPSRARPARRGDQS